MFQKNDDSKKSTINYVNKAVNYTYHISDGTRSDNNDFFEKHESFKLYKDCNMFWL